MPLLSLQTTPISEAFAAVTVNVELCPGLTAAGLALIVTVGFGAVTVTVTWEELAPPLPVAVNV